MTVTPVGWRIYYGDGTTFTSKQGTPADAPNSGVQVVKVFYAETYRCWHGHKWDGHWETHNYQKVLHGALQLIDYYWPQADGDWDAGLATAIPIAFSGTPKQGSLISADAFRNMANAAHQEETWSA